MQSDAPNPNSRQNRTLNDILACLVDFRETDSWPFLELAVADYVRRGDDYHGWAHIMHMGDVLLECWQSNRPGVDVPRWLALAVLYHDLIYAPGAPDNEEKSAQLLKRQFGSAEGISDACEAIRLTTHRPEDYCEWIAKGPAKREEIEWFLDADMAILGEIPARYDAYRAAVRREYGMFSDEEFRQGRRTFLEGALSRKALFHSDWFRDRFQRQATDNLSKELASLSEGSSC